MMLYCDGLECSVQCEISLQYTLFGNVTQVVDLFSFHFIGPQR